MKNEPNRPYGSKTDLPLLFDPAARRGRPHARLHQGPNGGVGGAGGRDGYGACAALHAHVHPRRGHHHHVGPFAHGLHDPKTCWLCSDGYTLPYPKRGCSRLAFVYTCNVECGWVLRSVTDVHAGLGGSGQSSRTRLLGRTHRCSCMTCQCSW
jgi:hypothetical protein